MRIILFLNIILILFTNYSKSQSWTPVDMGTNNAVMTLYNDTINDLLYVGGYFNNAGSIQANLIATWDGISWGSLGLGISGTTIRCIKEFQGDIYVGGYFSIAGGVLANNIAKWDGTNWQSLQGGVDGMVMSMEVFNNELYITGNFNNANGNPASKIAKWDGSNWSTAGTGFNGSGFVLKVSNGILYAGGDFTMVEGQPAYYIAQWDNVNWSAVGNGLGGSVISMANYNGKLYITYGPSTAIWDGTYLAAWNNGSEMDNNIMHLLSFNNELYYGGHFTVAGGNTVNYIAKWNQQGWSSFSSGMNSGVYSMAVYKNELYAGGWYTIAGGNSINYISKWNLTTTVKEKPYSIEDNLTIFPNPFKDNTTISFYANENEPINIEIFNNMGYLVKTISNQHSSSNQLVEFPIDCKGLSKGIYYTIVKNGRKTYSKKIIKL